MNDLPITEFDRAIQAICRARSQLRERVGVVEKFQGETVWEGEVLVFELLDHPTAPKCYAWEVDGEVTVVLHESPVGSAQEAVRAAIMEEEPSGNGNS